LTYVGASTLFVSLSDLNIAFIIPPLLFFAWWYDEAIRKMTINRAFYCLLVLAVILAGDYLGVAQVVLGLYGSTAAHAGSWELPVYAEKFLLPTIKSFYYPSFGYPHFSYIAPLLPLILIPLIFGPQKGLVARRVSVLVLVIVALLMLGVVGHGVESFRQRLPSAMRYHLSIVPFLCSLFLVYLREPIENCFMRLTRRWLAFGLTLTVVTAVFYVISMVEIDNATWISDAWLSQLGFAHWRIALIILVGFWPLWLFAIVSAFSRYNYSLFVRGFLFVSAAVVITGGYYFMQLCGLPFFSYIDYSLKATLYDTVPNEINRIIESSDYGRAARSTVPLARGVYKPSQGRNDKLLPLQEYPESYNARSFFHYRYSLSSHTTNLYSQVIEIGAMAFPPSPDRIDRVIEFADKTDSPFIIGADAEIADVRVEKLGSIPILPSYLLANRPDLNPGLIGDIDVYGLKALRPEMGSDHAPKASYFRTYAKFHDVRSGDKLPITYFDSLRACDENGREVLLKKRADGFSQIAEGMSAKMLTVTSFSYLGIFSLLSPLAAWIILYLGVLRRLNTD
jgi:hypothetical protein